MAEHNEKIVVVAGGTSGIGRHIVDGIVATKKYTVKVFTRQDPSALTDLTDKEVNVIKVDYDDHASLVKELQGESNTVVQLYRELKTPVLEKVKASGIEYTVFMTGIFMDYFASSQKASPFLSNLIIGVDFNKCEADIVGTGDEPFCITRGEDVGRFIAAAIDLEKWDEKLGMN